MGPMLKFSELLMLILVKFGAIPVPDVSKASYSLLWKGDWDSLGPQAVALNEGSAH